MLTFFRSRSDRTYWVEASSDFANLSAIATNPGTVIDRLNITTANPLQRFLRLHVSLP